MKIISIKRTKFPSTRVVDLEKYSTLEVHEVIPKIVNLCTHLANFWGNGAIGWAPEEVSEQLSKARMDRMISFSNRLNDIIRPVDKNEEEAHLITSWVTLGALIEGALGLFFIIWRDDYLNHGPRHKKDKVVEPNKLSFDQLKSLMLEHELIDKISHDWIGQIQQYRNVVHFFKDRTIGSMHKFHQSVKSYLAFLEFIHDSLPYPDEMYRRT